MNQSRRASFSFATFQGKTEGVDSVWLCFWGTYTLTMNVEMWQFLIDSIDDGQPEEGLDDDTYDLVEAMEHLLPESNHVGMGPTNHTSTRLFSLTVFNNTYSIQCRLEGLELLQNGVTAGADYDDPDGGRSLYAFTGQAATLIAREKERKASREPLEPAPKGYVTERRRRRRSDPVGA